MAIAHVTVTVTVILVTINLQFVCFNLQLQANLMPIFDEQYLCKTQRFPLI